MVDRMKSKKLADLRVAVGLEDGEDKEVLEEAVALIHHLADEISQLETNARLALHEGSGRRKKWFRRLF
jgi:hypothetical protein